MGRQGFRRLANLPLRLLGMCNLDICQVEDYTITLYERRNIKSVAESVC
jgi:hypothetical protein